MKYSFAIILLQCFTLSMLLAINEPVSSKSVKEQRVDRIMQTRMISGTVTAQDTGEGLPGVNVVEKGTNNGTVTDIQGNYTLEVSEGATLTFSSVGYITESIPIANRSTIDLTMRGAGGNWLRYPTIQGFNFSHLQNRCGRHRKNTYF